MRDLLPPDAERRARLSANVAATFASYGYERVGTPPFEHAEVLERGLRDFERRSLLRFVESESGEVALLRPDITPQIARIVATRLSQRPMPQRLCYQGTTLRRRRGRARKQRQSTQAGVECVGLSGPAADAEVIEVAARAVLNAGLSRFRLELHDVRVGRQALAAVPENARLAAERALSEKDSSRLERVLEDAGLKHSARRPLLRLTELYGDFTTVLGQARRTMRDATTREALDRLDRVRDHLGHAGLSSELDLDLGEVRGQAYYTGVSFALLADGPGEAVGAGGRYDALLARFGSPNPATGFALDIGHLEWALREACHPTDDGSAPRITLLGDGPEARRWAHLLRQAGLRVTRLGETTRPKALLHARAWSADALLDLSGRSVRATRVADGARRDLGALDAEPDAHLIENFGGWAAAAAPASRDFDTEER